MKARIAKLEGETRSTTKLQDSLSSHVKLLENALKKEREKWKASNAAERPASRGKASVLAQKGEAKAAPTDGVVESKRTHTYPS